MKRAAVPEGRCGNAECGVLLRSRVPKASSNAAANTYLDVQIDSKLQDPLT